MITQLHTWWATAIIWLVTFDQILKIVAPLTKTPVDDNLADMLGKLLARLLGKAS